MTVVQFRGHIRLGYPGGHYALGSLAPTWALSALAVGAGGVMTMATVVGDWSRYVPPARRGLLPVGLLAIAVSFITPEAVGAIVTTAFRDPYASFPATLVSAGPGWYAVLLLPAALVGGLGFSAATVYSTGLD